MCTTFISIVYKHIYMCSEESQVQQGTHVNCSHVIRNTKLNDPKNINFSRIFFITVSFRGIYSLLSTIYTCDLTIIIDSNRNPYTAKKYLHFSETALNINEQFLNENF